MSAEQLDVAGIRARAEAAHRGDWEAAKTIDGRWGVADSRALNPFAEDKWGAITVGVEMTEADAAHIAGMDPVMTLALVDEVERLRRWKAEAIEVLNGWERVHDALGRPATLGQRKSEASLTEVERLRAERAGEQAVRDDMWLICSGCGARYTADANERLWDTHDHWTATDEATS